MNKIQGVWARCFDDMIIYEINDTLEDIQRVVDGHFEVVRLWDGIVLLCKEDGRIDGYSKLNMSIFRDRNNPHDSFWIFGDAFFCAEQEGPDGGEFVSLSDEQLQSLRDYAAYWYEEELK